MLKRAIKEGNLWAYLFVLPAAVFYGLFTIKSVIGSFILSFTDWNGVNPTKRFVGLQNYANMLKDPIAGLALRNNLIWIFMSLVLSIGTALFLAVLISNVTRGQAFFRLTLFLPNVLSVAATGLIWGRIYDPFIGVINLLLKAVGLAHIARGWLGDPRWALPAINVANSWRGYGYYMVLFIAGLQAVDPSLYDAAKVDGANGWAQFVNVTLPGISHTMTLVLTLATINALRTFDMVWVMTQGGPFYRSEVLSTHIYKSAFTTSQVGYGASMSIALGLVITLLSVIMIRIRERGEV